MVMKLAKEGNTTSRIGTILRDQYSIPLVKLVTGKTITKILKDTQLAPTMPEDLASLMKKAENMNLHSAKNKTDLHNKKALQIIEAKIHKLSRYYKRIGVLPKNWKYEAKIASLA